MAAKGKREKSDWRETGGRSLWEAARWLLFHNPPVAKMGPGELGKTHRDASETIRRTMFSLLALALFCLLVTLGTPDRAFVSEDVRIAIPFVGVPVSFVGFMIAGPFLLIALTVHMQVFLGYLNRLEKAPGFVPGTRLPTLFNLDQVLARILAWFTFYALTPLVLAAIAWKASVRPDLAWPLWWTAIIVALVLLFLPVRRRSVNWRLGVISLGWGGVLAGFFFLLNVMVGPEAFRRELNLHRASLAGAWLVGADLRAARLSYADLNQANLERAQLEKAVLDNAILKSAHLAEANLPNAKLQFVDAAGADFRGASLVGSDLATIRAGEADFSNANLTGAILTGGELGRARFVAARLGEADLSYANLEGADFTRANLQGANLTGSNLSGANFTGAVFLAVEQVCAAETDLVTRFPSGNQAPKGRSFCKDAGEAAGLGLAPAPVR